MIEDLTACLPAERFGVITTQENATTGLSGATVRVVTTTTGRYLLRVFHGDRETWDRTLAAHQLAAGSGIAPPLVQVDQRLRCTVSQMIEGSSFAAAVGQPGSRQAALASVVSMLAKLHTLPTGALPASSTRRVVRQLWESQCRRDGFPAWALALAPQLDASELRLAHDDRQVLCHGDLNPSNILWDGARVWLIDWDTAGLAHPYLDLACLSNFLGLPDEAATGLLAMQEQSRISDEQRVTFRACRDLARIAYGCVFLRLVPDLTRITFTPAAGTVPLAECFSRVAGGSLSLASAEGQALVGAAFFKQGLEG